jgi:hypothetical protein
MWQPAKLLKALNEGTKAHLGLCGSVAAKWNGGRLGMLARLIFLKEGRATTEQERQIIHTL